MKVLFLKHVINVWKEGDIKEVKPWYAQNFLFPKWLAIELTQAEEKKHKDKLKKEDSRRRQLIENRHEIAEKLNGIKLDFSLRASWWSKVFWAIWEKDILREIKNKFQIDLSKKHVDMPSGHIKKLWEEFVFIKLWKDASAKVIIDVKPEWCLIFELIFEIKNVELLLRLNE